MEQRHEIRTQAQVGPFGMDVAGEVIKRYDSRLKIKILKKDGERASVADRLGVITGPLRSILSAERVMLNFLQRLCPSMRKCVIVSPILHLRISLSTPSAEG